MNVENEKCVIVVDENKRKYRDTEKIQLRQAGVVFTSSK